MKIYRVTDATPQLIEALARLLPQLSSSATMPSEEHLKNLLSNSNIHLVAAECEGVIAGMLTLAIVDIPTGRKAWIEDVVTDDSFRGRGVGRALVEKAIAAAEEAGARRIYLTSNPSRKAAHALYAKCGFEQYDTGVFRLNISHKE
ncbi:MAG: GNAT family N-acetyltransferase [Alistipes sp.]|nr:GNAT family N-acetyltransferase [Alistipes sp.]